MKELGSVKGYNVVQKHVQLPAGQCQRGIRKLAEAEDVEGMNITGSCDEFI